MSNYDKKINIGLVGLGYLGQFHLKHLMNLSQFNLKGIFDINDDHGSKIATKNKLSLFNNYNDLIQNVEAVCIATPTETHYELAMEALNHNKHVFIEKPICMSVSEAKKILIKKNKHNKIVQIGHIERFNPAFLMLHKNILHPKYINAERISPYNTRGTEISVVLDLMIHDIDLILSLIKSDIKDIFAKGLNVLSNNIDMAIAQLIFKNGTVAWLTASRIAKKQSRQFRVIDQNKYYSLDLLNHQLQSQSLNAKNKLTYNKHSVIKQDALKLELEAFANSIFNQKDPITNVESAINVLQCVKLIEKQVYTNY